MVIDLILLYLISRYLLLNFILLFFLYSVLPPPALQDGNDKHGHALDQHTPERRDSHRYHDIRPLTGRGKYGEQSDQGSGCSHGRWAYPFQSGGYYRFPDIVLGAGGSLEEYMMDVGSHQYPIIRSHTEQGDETDPDCHAQIDRVHLEKIPHILSGDGEVHEPILSVKP